MLPIRVYELVQRCILPSHMYKFVQNTSNIRFGDIQLVFKHELQKAISNEICHLVEQMNTWSSTICPKRVG